MNKVLLFGGTGEGRALAEWMVARDIPHTVCVATEYGTRYNKTVFLLSF